MAFVKLSLKSPVVALLRLTCGPNEVSAFCRGIRLEPWELSLCTMVRFGEGSECGTM